MLACGIRVFHIEQLAGDVVLGDGDVVHLGCCTNSHLINEAINFMPVHWLATGLPRLLQWSAWLGNTYIPLRSAARDDVRKVAYDEVVLHNLRMQVPCAWTIQFLHDLTATLRRDRQLLSTARTEPHFAGSSIDYGDLSASTLDLAASQCEMVAALLRREDVQRWYNEQLS